MSRTPIQFEIDENKADNIARALKGLIEQRHWLVSVPEYQLPRNLQAGTREHALYLTYTISIDYMTNAEKLWNKARGACKLYPERFTPEKIFAVSDKTLEVFVRRLGLRFGPSAATFTSNSPRIKDL